MKIITKGGLLLTLSLSIFGLTACSNSGNNATVAEYGNNKKVSQEQFYKELKSSPNSKTVLANLLIYDALNEQYGKKINNREVNKEYNNYKQRYGSQFNDFLEQNSYTKASFKRMIKINYLSNAALRAQMKPTNKQLQEAWKTYQPAITVQHILTTSRATAENVINQLNDGKSFASLAEKYSVDSATSSNAGKLPAFTNDNRRLDSSFKNAAYKLKNGQYTKTPVKVTNGYEVIKMINHPAKGTFAENKQNLTNEIYERWASNSTVMRNVISQVLKDQKVSIKDKDLQSALDQYKGSTKSVASNN